MQDNKYNLVNTADKEQYNDNAGLAKEIGQQDPYQNSEDENDAECYGFFPDSIF